MKSVIIKRVQAVDCRFSMHDGAGSDAVHAIAEYAVAVTRLSTDGGIAGCGITLTLGDGNRVVCDLIAQLGKRIAGSEIEDLMSDFGSTLRSLADHPALRWLG